MDRKEIQTFLTVAETSSITAAAQILGKSQPTITRTIQELESELGFALLNRIGRGVNLSEEGMVFEQEARRVLASFQELTRRSQDIAKGKGRSLPIAATAALGNGLLPDAIEAMEAGCLPDEIQITQFLPAVVAQEVRSGRADLGFCSVPVDPAGLRFESHYTANMAAAVPENDPLAKLDAIPLDAFAGRRLVTMLRSLRVPQLVSRAMESQGVTPGQIIRTNVSYSALQLVQRAQAVSIIDPVSAWCIPVPGVQIRPIQADLPFVWAAISNAGLPLRQVAADLIDAVRAMAEPRIPDFRELTAAAAAELIDDNPVDRDDFQRAAYQ